MRAPGILLPAVAMLIAGSMLNAQVPSPRSPTQPKTTAAAKPKPAPPPAPVIEGLVRGPDRKPLDKALVIAVGDASAFPRWQAGDPPVTARTGPDGRFRLTLRKARPQTVRVEASGLAAAIRKDVSPGASLTIDLTKGGTIEGLVRDGETGQPVPQAKVTAAGAQSIPVPDDPDAGRVVATTDAAGRFKLEGLASGLHSVTARSRMAGYATLPNVRLGARVELLVFPAATISGTVVGPDGKPVPRAIVGINGRRPFGGSGNTESADALGRYELNGLSPGTYDVIARAPGLAAGVAADVVLERRSDARVDLTLRPGVRVVGRLVDGNERPVPGRVGVGELDGRMTPFALVESLRTEALADGRFAIENVPAGEHALGIGAPGFAPERVDFTARASDRQVDVGDIHLDVGLAIRGRVRTQAGGPVADATIRAFAMRRGAGIAEGLSQADGSFALAGLEQVVYTVNVQAPGFGMAEKQAEPGGDPLDVVLDAAGTITGQVVDERGRPIESFRVSAVVSGGGAGPRFRMMPSTEEITADDGRFTLTNLSTGKYVVSATAPDHAAGSVPGVAVTAGAAVDVGPIKLAAGGIVKGTVADATGGPVAGARLSISGQGQNWMPTGDEPQGLSDGSGAFEIKGVAVGRAQVVASHPNYARSEPVATEVDPAKAPVDLRIVMTQGGRVEGSVRRRDGTPMPSLLVSARGAGGMDFGMSLRETSATTGADGSFAIERVRPGRGTLTVMPSTPGGAMSSVLRRDFEVRDGETTSVELVLREILISGRVTRAGAPAAALRIEARASSQFMIGGGPTLNTPPAATSGPQRMFAVTRDDGSYEMLVDEPGTIRFVVTSADGRSQLPMRTAEVPDADAFAFDMAFAGAPVTGIVVDKDTDAPIGYAQVSARRPKGEGPFGGSATTGSDGRFQLEVEPGDYVVQAHVRDGATDYGSAEQAVSVGEAGVTDVRLAMPKGLAISGKVTDAGGRPVPWADVRAISSDGQGAWGGQSLADGSFTVSGLKTGAYTVIAEAEAGAFAIRPGVSAGTKAVGLVLEPGGRLLLTVEGPNGEPVAGVWPRVTHVGGLFVAGTGRPVVPTDPQGVTEMVVPAGELTIGASKDALRGMTNVTIAPGQTERVRMVVRPGNPEALRR